jgi:competence protein ComEC
MSHSSTPIALIGSAFGLGILLQEFSQPNFGHLYPIGFGIALIVCHIKRWYVPFLVSMFCGFLVLGSIRLKPLSSKTTSTETIHELVVTKAANTNAFGHQYIALTSNKEHILVQTTLAQGLSIGDRLLIRAKLSPIQAPKNPMDFDFKTHMQRKGVMRKINLAKTPFTTISPKPSVLRWAYKLQQKLISQLKHTPLNQNNQALVMALVLGHKAELSEERIVQYQRAGAMHLLAISGLHIGVVLMLLRFFVRPLKSLRYGKTLAALLPVLFLWCFVLITGGSASVTRAVTMFTFLQMGLALARKNASIQGVWASFVILLFVNPRFIFDVGFQLSYAAVFGIVWMMPRWQHLFIKKHWSARYLADLFGVGCIAQLAILPLSLYYFNQFPLLFWVSNLVLVPLLGFIIAMAIASVGISFVPSAYPAYDLANSIFDAYQHTVAWIAQWERFFIENIPFRSIDALLLSMTIISLFIFITHPTLRKIWLLGVLTVLFHVNLLLQWKAQPKTLIGHVYKNSLILTNEKEIAIAYYAKKTKKVMQLALQFQLDNRLDSIRFHRLNNSYTDLLVIDSLGIYKGVQAQDRVLLRQSPKIHLDDVIEHIKPTIIIADGSNYPSFIARWQATCKAKKITFHNTAAEGSYPLN